MFLELIKLFGKKEISNKTPLEDFNTECFAGILKLNENIKNDFITEFLKLPEDEYTIDTQLWKSLLGHKNCIIDMFFLGKNNICFIENKVESSEGEDQLLRYGLVLDRYYNDFNKHLFYCTKHTDLKNQDGKYKEYNFKQFKWFDIANFLKTYQNSNSLIKDYLHFLNFYKMAQDNTFRVENILSMQNMLKTIEIAEFHIKNSSAEFDEIFNNKSKKSFFNIDQLYNESRICNYKKDIIISEKGKYSEIMYSIQFEALTISTHIYLNSEHEKINDFKKINKENPFDDLKRDHGYTIFLIDDLTKYINKEDSDKTIKEWFTNSFEKMKGLIDSNPTFEWSI